jgi:hypothetical protein
MHRKMSLYRLFPLLITSFLMVSLNAYAGSISGGVDDAGIIARTQRDGASGFHIIDLDSKISGDGRITSWSIWAESYMSWIPDTVNTAQRQLGLIIFRDTGSGYLVVGESPLETIPSGALAWNKKYTFTNLGAGIQVKKGDYLGIYYPFQGSDIWGPYDNPGGVIAFDNVAIGAGGHNVRFRSPWGSQQPPELAVGALIPYDWFNIGPEVEGAGRILSFNVTGVANVSTAPNTLLLPD